MIDAQKQFSLDDISSLRSKIYPKELTTLGEGYYDAIVTRCIDKANPGWIKVSITGITDNLPLIDQPWAEPSPGNVTIIPTPGSNVLVTFREGDVHLPVWHSASLQNNGKFFPRQLTVDYPDSHIIYNSPDGTHIVNNTKSGELQINHHTGATLTIDNDGNFVMKNANGTNPLVQQYPVVTGAVVCPYLASIAAATGGATAANTLHPTANPILKIDDQISP